MAAAMATGMVTHVAVLVQVDLPLVEGHHPVLVQVEVLEAGDVYVGGVGV